MLDQEKRTHLIIFVFSIEWQGLNFYVSFSA
jgi:hypothetical protein